MCSSGSIFLIGTTNVLCRGSDSSLNNGSCSFNITVNDNEAPILTCPTFSAPVNLPSTSSNISVSWTLSVTENTGVGNVVTHCSLASGSLFFFGTTSVSCNATDKAGNVGKCSFYVTTLDVTAPVITCPPAIFVNTATGKSTANVSYIQPVVFDNDVVQSILCNFPSPTVFPVGLTTITCTATDRSNNANSCLIAVIVSDTEFPVIVCPASISNSTAASLATFTATYAAPAATDNVGISGVPSCSYPSPNAFPVGITTVTCTAQDQAGNSKSCSFTVSITDTEAPILTCPVGAVLGSSAPLLSTGLVSFSVSVTDNVNSNLASTCSPASGKSFLIGNTTVVCNSTDAAGNKNNCSFVVLVLDMENPVLTCPLLGSFALPAYNSTVSVSYNVAIFDNSNVTTAPSCSKASGSFFSLGSTLVTCSATDPSQNTGRCSFAVVVVDETAPTVTCALSAIFNTTAGLSTYVYVYASPNATDNAGVASISCFPSSNSFSVGTTVVTCTAADATGNRGTCSFNVVVSDYEAPNMTCPPSISHETDANKMSHTTAYGSVTALDNVGIVGTPSCNYGSPFAFPFGVNTITCSVFDAAGNSKTCSFTVTVTDNQRPTLTCPSSMDLSTSVGLGTTVATWSVLVSDNVDATVNVSCTVRYG